MKRKAALLSIAHFGVDFASAALYFGYLSGSKDWWTVLLLYNACAFAMQMPIGLLSDLWNRNRIVAAIGCVLVAAAYPLASVPLLSAVVAGLGNGAFHVGAGLEVLNSSGNRAGPLGVFVSPGAIGLYLGTAYASFWREHIWIVFLLLALCLAASACSERKNLLSESGNADCSVSLEKGMLLPLICLALVVVLRSALGFTNAFSTQMTPKMIAALCVAGGKAIGGVLDDCFGIKRVSVLSLAACMTVLLIPGDAAKLVALLLFNMTMPLTLWGAARYLKQAKGFSFGLLTFALFLGLLPRLLQISVPDSLWLYLGVAACSMLLLLLGLKRTDASWN